jgi:hypothetical protein
MYIRSLFEANSGVRDPRLQRASLPVVLSLVAFPNIELAGFIPRDRGLIGEMEASRSVPSTNCSWGYACTQHRWT